MPSKVGTNMFDESPLFVSSSKSFEIGLPILENNRKPKTPSEVQHKYDDKFKLAEFLAKIAIASVLNSFSFID